MSARRPRQAVDLLVDRLRPVAGCVSHRPLIAVNYRRTATEFSISFAPLQSPVRLDVARRNRVLHLATEMSCLVVRAAGNKAGYRALITAYYFLVLDRDEHEIVAYHWHPGGGSRATTPHMHVSNQLPALGVGRGQEPLMLSDLHFPTGYVHLRDIVRFLIEELDVQPLRDDWRHVLLADERGGQATEG